MRTQLRDTRVVTVFLLLLAMALVAGLIGGCTAEEPAGSETPGTGTDAGTPPDTAAPDTGTRPAGELPEGATHAVADVLDTPSEGTQVVVFGEITEMRGAEDFMLKDDTGEIFVDGDNDFLPLAVGDTVLVTGLVKVEDSPARVEIDATAVERR